MPILELIEVRKIMSNTIEKRIGYLDAMRGICAIGVLLCHWACVFAPGLYFPDKASSVFEAIWRGSPLNIITNGDIGVQFFFVCSGLLITQHAYNRNRSTFINWKSVLKKYTSLLWVIVPAVLFSFILMRSGLMYHTKLMELGDNYSFLRDYNQFNPTYMSALADIIKTPFSGSSYNGPLWTMKHQLIGSLLIMMCSSWIVTNANLAFNRKIIFIIMAVPFIYIDYYLSGFFFGAFIYECYYSLAEDDSILGKLIRWSVELKPVKILVLIVGIYIACINCTPFTGVYRWLAILQRANPVIRAFGIAVVLFIIMNSTRLQVCIDSKVMRWFGKLSPYIYAFHWPIILSLGCGMYMKLRSHFSNNLLISLVLLVCIITSTLISYFYNMIEILIKKSLRRIK